MSEYQYYEFQAVDRPLTAEEMAELRRLSSRATITPSSFVNVYSYGDFRGEPQALMKRYFDAFVYMANWGTREFMLRLPRRVLDLPAVAPYLVEGGLDAHTTDDAVILHFHSDAEEPEWIDGEGWLARLLPLRADLAAGDLRSLYVGWLACIWVGGDAAAEADEPFADAADFDDETIGLLEDRAVEPPLPPGLNQPNAALQALAEFLRVDEALLEVAAERSAPLSQWQPDAHELESWVHGLAAAEKDALLLRLLQEGEGALRREMLERVRRGKEERAAPSGKQALPPRTVQQLREAAQRRQGEERQAAEAQAARERAEREREQAAARARHLDGLVGHDAELWDQVAALIEMKRAADYDQAVQLLRDLRDLADRAGQAPAFQERLTELRHRFAGRSALQRRLDASGLR